MSSSRNTRWFAIPALVAASALCVAGCAERSDSIGRLEKVWGRRGISDGRFQKPRAMTIDALDHLYIVNMTARIQVFDTEGNFLCAWQTPEHSAGRPTGLSIDRDGNVMVADTHYYRVLIYSPEGELLRTIGGTKGDKPGQFGLVSAVAQDSAGNYYIAEYGEYDRIQKYTRDASFIIQWGGTGSDPGQFRRPQRIVLDENEDLWVADVCNHRLQVFDRQGKLLKCWGAPGAEPGQLYYPYDLALAPDGTIFVAEWGNHRIQRFTRDGRSLGCWGSGGREEGQLCNPWALTRDTRGRIHVLDTGNNRVQTVKISAGG